MIQIMNFKQGINSLSIRVFLLIFALLLLPVYISFIIIRNLYENYIRQELSNQIIANIERGEEEFNNAFHRMASISNVFTLDDNLISILLEPDSSYYDRNRQFDVIVQSLYNNYFFDLRDIRITMFDTKNQTYANWSLNFYNYTFLLDLDWVQETMTNKGHISWSLFSPSFIREEKEKYISLSRSIFYPPYTGDRLATFIISINQRGISEILSRQGMNSDFIYICTLNSMEEVFITDAVNILNHDDIINLMTKINGRARGSLLHDQKNVRYLLSYYLMATPWSFDGQPFMVLHFTNYQHITDSLSAFSSDINIGMLLFLFILTIMVSIFSWMITRPIRRLDERVKNYARTREIQKYQIRGEDEIANLSRTFLDMQITINELFDKLKEESEIREQYRFQALRAQINPHFLFNTLNTIRWMAMIRRADNITDTIDALVRMLEYSIKGDWEFVFLREELDMIRNYLHIQNYRYGEDSKVFIEIPQQLEEYRIIKFILQPIVENAFLHAFKNIAGEKMIHISGIIDRGCLKLFVRDNGIGLSPEKLNELNGSFDLWDKKKARGIGLPSVFQRIKIEHGADYGLHLTSIPGEGTTVEYTLPLLKWDILNYEAHDR